MNNIFVSFNYTGTFGTADWPMISTDTDYLVIEYDQFRIIDEESFEDFRSFVREEYMTRKGYATLTITILNWKILS